MNLKKFIRENKQQMTILVPFKGIFTIELVYTDRPEMNKMLELSKTRRWVKHQEIETLDDDLFNRQLASRIRAWTGLTLGKLADMVNIDISGENPDTEVPYSVGNAEMLVSEV